jgi:hypothetical protein
LDHRDGKKAHLLHVLLSKVISTNPEPFNHPPLLPEEINELQAKLQNFTSKLNQNSILMAAEWSRILYPPDKSLDQFYENVRLYLILYDRADENKWIIYNYGCIKIPSNVSVELSPDDELINRRYWITFTLFQESTISIDGTNARIECTSDDTSLSNLWGGYFDRVLTQLPRWMMKTITNLGSRYENNQNMSSSNYTPLSVLSDCILIKIKDETSKFDDSNLTEEQKLDKYIDELTSTSSTSNNTHYDVENKIVTFTSNLLESDFDNNTTSIDLSKIKTEDETTGESIKPHNGVYMYEGKLSKEKVQQYERENLRMYNIIDSLTSNNDPQVNHNQSIIPDETLKNILSRHFRKLLTRSQIIEIEQQVIVVSPSKSIFDQNYGKVTCFIKVGLPAS